MRRVSKPKPKKNVNLTKVEKNINKLRRREKIDMENISKGKTYADAIKSTRDRR